MDQFGFASAIELAKVPVAHWVHGLIQGRPLEAEIPLQDVTTTSPQAELDMIGLLTGEGGRRLCISL